ncbi:FAD/NAD(P)-binding domain-containing protein [Auriscalpium vulgare]|uniref:FAD/NAD(P)-binding domain-containing protein n=1 Tax=Auriscalpium vulgare TaxID=40419 RepID=A0ACB8RBU5_9AGAM|nr:FAD/NAD(P)-binding domain-containing protein [Auriscalpium vulgare]
MASTLDIKQAALPTLDRLQAMLPDTVDTPGIATTWFKAFTDSIETVNVAGVLDLLLEDAFWRDILALTWDFRTLYGVPSIHTFLDDCLTSAGISNLKLDVANAQLQTPYPDLAWIQAVFTFDTHVGHGSGVVRIVPTATGAWKAHAISTYLEELHGHPENTGLLREQKPNHGKWHSKRQREINCEGPENQPKVVIIGGGQAGLEVAARLKYLGVKALVVERQPRVGNQWRTRYEALCLHDPVWHDHMPYLPFPLTWPVYAPAPKLADWLEHYAHTLELDVWTSSEVTSAKQDPKTQQWALEIKRGDGAKRTFVVNHLIFAVGLGGGVMNMPSYPGTEDFQGKAVHSGQFTTAKDYLGKKVVVVGACSSGHDISKDLCDHGIDVTMVQRGATYVMSTKNGFPTILGSSYCEGGPPPDVADRIASSFPHYLMKLFYARYVQKIAELDKEIIDGLERVGFKLGWGVDGSGYLLLAFDRAGGFYLDVGASQLIIDGKIKLKNDSQISRFTKTGLQFEDGSTLDADMVVFATGYGDARQPLRALLGDEVGDKLNRIWGLDAEGEIYGAWRDTGVPRLYVMMGSLAMCRIHSKHLALQIKAIEEGVFDGQRYSVEA